MKTQDKFSGFTPETFQFFRDLKENNYKPWFDEHKHIYEQEVLLPLRALTLAMTPAMYAIDSQMDFRTNKIVSRIYRDIRFSHDKQPYKTNMWFTFQRLVDNWEGFPGYYMEIGSEGYQYGMGLFMAKRNVMDYYRSRVEYEPNHFRDITEDLVTKHGFTLGGELYKRPLDNNLPEYFQDWIQRKSIYVHKTPPVEDLLFSEDFATHMINEFTLLQPLYEFFIDICD